MGDKEQILRKIRTRSVRMGLDRGCGTSLSLGQGPIDFGRDQLCGAQPASLGQRPAPDSEGRASVPSDLAENPKAPEREKPRPVQGSRVPVEGLSVFRRRAAPWARLSHPLRRG
jgi:hypothetical protein